MFGFKKKTLTPFNYLRGMINFINDTNGHIVLRYEVANGVGYEVANRVRILYYYDKALFIRNVEVLDSNNEDNFAIECLNTIIIAGLGSVNKTKNL